MAATHKEVLVDHLWKSMKEEQRKPTNIGDVKYFLDGGALLLRVGLPLPRVSTYVSKSHLYVMRVTHNYGAAVITLD